MGKMRSLGLDRVLEHIVLTSVGSGRKAPPQGGSAGVSLPTGQRRILEHVAMMLVEKRIR